MESVGLAPAMALGLTLLGTAKVGEQLEGWAPLLEFHLPVQHDRCGDHNQVGTPIAPAQVRSLQPTSRRTKTTRQGLGCRVSTLKTTARIFLDDADDVVGQCIDSMRPEVPDQQARTTSQASIVFIALPRS